MRLTLSAALLILALSGTASTAELSAEERRETTAVLVQRRDEIAREIRANPATENIDALRTFCYRYDQLDAEIGRRTPGRSEPLAATALGGACDRVRVP